MSRPRSPAFPVRFLAAMLVVAAGCDASRPDSRAVEIRDSAGIEIVESRAPLWGAQPLWRVGTEALLRIGASDTRPGHQFSDVVGAVRLPGGGVAVADGSAAEVRFFDASGELVAVVGGPGEGPGEFARLAGLGPGPDGGLWAWDFGLRRLTWIDPDGGIRRVASLPPQPPVLDAAGPLGSDTFLFRQLWGARAAAVSDATGFRRDPVAWVVFDGAGHLTDTLAMVPGREVILTSENGRGVMTTPLFGRTSSGTVRRGRAVIGDQVAHEVREFDAEGDLRRIVRFQGPDLGLDEDEYAVAVEDRVAEAPPAARPGVRRSYAEMPRPERRPSHGALFAGGEGDLWVEEWAPGRLPPGRWFVFDSAGRWLGRVEAPPGFTATQVGRDWIVGVETDDLGVESVVVRRILKDATAAR